MWLITDSSVLCLFRDFFFLEKNKSANKLSSWFYKQYSENIILKELCIIEHNTAQMDGSIRLSPHTYHRINVKDLMDSRFFL